MWRAFRGVGYDPHADPAEPPPKDQTGWYGAAALLSFLFVAGPLFGPVTAFVVAITGGGSSTDGSRPVVAGTWLLLGIGIPVLAFLGARQGHRWWRAREHGRRRDAEQRARLAQAGRCLCWQARSVSGPFAAEYLLRHLRPEPLPPLPVHLPASAALGRCVTTGALWLTLDGTDPGRALLLRGAAPPDAGPPSGQYL